LGINDIDVSNAEDESQNDISNSKSRKSVGHERRIKFAKKAKEINSGDGGTGTIGLI